MQTKTIVHGEGHPSLPRIDLVFSVLRDDATCATFVVVGTPSTSPVPPKVPVPNNWVHWFLMAEKWIAPAAEHPTTTLLV